MATTPVEIRCNQQIATYPVVTTGHRWPCAHEIIYGENWRTVLFEEHPELSADTRRRDLLLEPTPPMPEPGSPGGGLFPVLVQLNDGGLAAVTRTGAPHVGSGGELSLSFSSDGGRTWSEPTVVARGDVEDDLDCRDAALGEAGNGDLVLAYGLDGRHDATGQPSKHQVPSRGMWVTRSTDKGYSWSAPRQLQVPSSEPFPLLLHPFGQMRRLQDGRLVLNARGFYSPEAYAQRPDLPRRLTYLYWSDPGGNEWSEPLLVKAGMTETAFLPLDEDNWLAYVRNPHGPSQIARCADGGQTWHGWAPALGGREGSSRFRHPGSIALLRNGNVLITYGHRQPPFGVRAIVSRDGGKTFDTDREYIITDRYVHEDCGYPSTVCLADGTVVTLAYTVLDLDHADWGTCCIAYRYPQELFDL